MLVLLSPAKRLDEKSDFPTDNLTQSDFLEDTSVLADELKALDVDEITSLMKLSDKLGALNYERYQDFFMPFTPQNARPALFMFQGDVYEQMDIHGYNKDQLDFTQNHVRLLSGLYGMLRPLDMMQPYRLEMGTRFKNSRGKNLYEFWGSKLTNKLNSENPDVIVNLASNEYFSAVKAKELKPRLVTITFKHLKNGELKSFGMLAKRARGMMTDFIIKNAIEDVEKLKEFNTDGYSYQEDFSSENEWVFIKDTDVK